MAVAAHFSADSFAHRRTASKSLGNALSNSSVARGESSSSRYSARQQQQHPAPVYQRPTNEDDERRNFRAFAFPSPVSSPQLDDHPATLGGGGGSTADAGDGGTGDNKRDSHLSTSTSSDSREGTPPKVHRISPSLPYPPYNGPTASSSSSSLASSALSLARLAYSNVRRYRLGELLYAGAFVFSTVVFFSALAGLGHHKSSHEFGGLSPLLAAQDRGEPSLVVRPITIPTARPALHIDEDEETESGQNLAAHYIPQRSAPAPAAAAQPVRQPEGQPQQGKIEEPHDAREDLIRDSPEEYSHDDEADHEHEQHVPKPHSLFDPRPHRGHLDRLAAGKDGGDAVEDADAAEAAPAGGRGHSHGDAGLEQLIGDEVKGVGVEVGPGDRLVEEQYDGTGRPATDVDEDEDVLRVDVDNSEQKEGEESVGDNEDDEEEEEEEEDEVEAELEEKEARDVAVAADAEDGEVSEPERRDRLEFVDREERAL
jgi:hypothetical protein